jgi:adenylate cyclase
MAVEIERKFLVSRDGLEKVKQLVTSHHRLTQGYLNSSPDRTVRVRIKDDCAFMTVKGRSSESGLSRFEWEKEIAVADARELMALCEPGVIDKVRYVVEYEGYVFEVDEFFGENEGLVVAEVELKDEAENFVRPEWLGEEVTGQTQYYNSSLARLPYTKW